MTVGCFSADQYGVDAEFYRPFKDERFSLMARIGYTGMGSVSYTHLGIPFTKKPIAIQFDYKVKMSDREKRIRATGFSRITDEIGRAHV